MGTRRRPRLCQTGRAFARAAVSSSAVQAHATVDGGADGFDEN